MRWLTHEPIVAPDDESKNSLDFRTSEEERGIKDPSFQSWWWVVAGIVLIVLLLIYISVVA